MTKLILRMVVLFLATIGFNSAHAQQQSSHPLKCRGPLQYIVGTVNYSVGPGFAQTRIPTPTLIVFFVKNSSPAGNSGISLQPGTCAWNDRPVASGEPGKIYFNHEMATAVNEVMIRPTFTAFTTCAGNSKCVVEFSAYNANQPNDAHFQADGSYIRIYYPAFPSMDTHGATPYYNNFDYYHLPIFAR